jgi:hypothetical protein
MEKKTDAALKNFRTTDRTPEATEKLLFYCLAHPSSPSAMRRPQLSIRDDLWIALLGRAWKKELSGSDRAWNQHSALSMRNI